MERSRHPTKKNIRRLEMNMFRKKASLISIYRLNAYAKDHAYGSRYRWLGEATNATEQTTRLNQAQNAGPTSRPALFAPA
jgi:hypothetical protein